MNKSVNYQLCLRSYKVREQEANDALERKRQAILAQRKAETVQATMRFQRNLPGFTVMGKFHDLVSLIKSNLFVKIQINSIEHLKRSQDDNYPIDQHLDDR